MRIWWGEWKVLTFKLITVVLYLPAQFYRLKIPITSQCSSINWGPSVQIHEPVGTSHIKTTTIWTPKRLKMAKQSWSKEQCWEYHKIQLYITIWSCRRRKKRKRRRKKWKRRVSRKGKGRRVEEDKVRGENGEERENSKNPQIQDDISIHTWRPIGHRNRRLINKPNHRVEPTYHHSNEFHLFLCFGCSACMYVGTPCTCLVPNETRRGYFPWNWSYQRLWITVWVLGIKLRSFGTAANGLNCWAISPIPLSKFWHSDVVFSSVSVLRPY